MTTHPSHWDQRTHYTSLTLGPGYTQHIPHTGTRGHTTHPSHWDQRTHNTSLTLGPEDTQHIPHTGTRGHTTHPSHWDQRTHNTSLTLGPEDTQHIPHTGTRGHTTHPLHWNQRTHNMSGSFHVKSDNICTSCSKFGSIFPYVWVFIGVEIKFNHIKSYTFLQNKNVDYQ